MSDTQTVDPTDDTIPVHEEVERVARVNGWKPKSEFKGPPEKWFPADVFVARGLENPAVLADRNKVLSFKLDRLERVHTETTTGLRKELEDTRGTLGTMTEMMRKSEERAYARARRELQDERDKAVESGDTATFRKLDREMEELDKGKPVDPPKPAPTVTPPTPPAPTMQDPAVQRFYAENAWYHGTTRDTAMAAFADGVFNQIRTERPDLTADHHLDYVVKEVKSRFPAKFERTIGNQNGDARNDEPDDPDDSPVVIPSSGTPARRPNQSRFTFDRMPKESKEAYTKYAKQIASLIEQKGQHIKPLTQAEWAADYWAQFRDDGA